MKTVHAGPRSLLSRLGAVLVSFGLTGLTAAPAAPDPSSPPPTPEKLLERVVKALGGREALLKTQTRVTVGTMHFDAAQQKGPFRLQAKAPDKRLTEFEIPGIGTLREGCNGTLAWESNPATRVRQREGAAQARAIRFARFHRELEIPRLYRKLKTSGPVQVGSSMAYILEAIPEEGGRDRYYVDTKTGLIVRQDSLLETGSDTVETVVYYDDYRKVDGVLYPFRVRLFEPRGMRFVLQLSLVRHPLDLDDSIFDMPKP